MKYYESLGFLAIFGLARSKQDRILALEDELRAERVGRGLDRQEWTKERNSLIDVILRKNGAAPIHTKPVIQPEVKQHGRGLSIVEERRLDLQNQMRQASVEQEKSDLESYGSKIQEILAEEFQ